MRSEFEKLPEIAELIKDYKIKFNEDFSLYVSLLVHKSQCDYVNGAWYAFQEQQKKIDEHGKKLKIFIDELKKTHNDDKDNKINYWRGFSDCADSSVKVFLRDVGFIE